ncbi:ribosome biogenesis protein Nop53/GLTSCR2 [Melampsora americana]|nr:ribosome biogenesis protein Nop53/GLTSCR2 [Melampsora americana]
MIDTKSNNNSNDMNLFEVDTHGSESIRHTLLHGEASSRARKGVKPLKVDEILNEVVNNQNTTALLSRVRRQITDPKKSKNYKVKLLNHQERKRLEKMVLRKKHQSTLMDEGRSSTAVAIRPPPAPEDNLWANDSKLDIPIIPVKAPSHLRKHEILDKVTESLTTKAEAPGLISIPQPHPGQSYNPSFKDHQEVLNLAHQKLEAEEKEMKRLQTVKDRMNTSLAGAKRKEQWEFCEEEVDKIMEDDESEVEDLNRTEEQLVKKVKKQKKKTTAQRNRKARALEEARLLAKRRHAKLISKSLHELPTIVNSISQQKAISSETRLNQKSKRAQLIAKYGLQAIRGGEPKGLNSVSDQHTYQLTEDLTETGLRGLKTEGNLWRDWELSGIRRGKVQSKKSARNGNGVISNARSTKGRKLKEVEKHAWKNFEA